MDIIVGIGEYAVSASTEDIIKTFALGSCVALTVYCPSKKVLGMVHIALPDSGIDKEAGNKRPGHFADTAVPLLLDIFSKKYNCQKEGLVLNLYGGSMSIQKNDIFNIGRRNIDSILHILRTENISLKEKDTGGFVSRTIEAEVETGRVTVTSYPIQI